MPSSIPADHLKIIDMDQLVVSAEDVQLIVTCTIDSQPSNYNVSWLFNDQLITVDGHTFSLHCNGSQHQLTVRNGHCNGTYTCIVSTPYHGEEDRRILHCKWICFVN